MEFLNRNEGEGFPRTRRRERFEFKLEHLLIGLLVVVGLSVLSWPWGDVNPPSVDALDHYPFGGERTDVVPTPATTISNARPIMTSRPHEVWVERRVKSHETLWSITKDFMSEYGLNAQDEDAVTRLGMQARLLVEENEKEKRLPIDKPEKLQPGDTIVFPKIEERK